MLYSSQKFLIVKSAAICVAFYHALAGRDARSRNTEAFPDCSRTSHNHHGALRQTFKAEGVQFSTCSEELGAISAERAVLFEDRAVLRSDRNDISTNLKSV